MLTLFCALPAILGQIFNAWRLTAAFWLLATLALLPGTAAPESIRILAAGAAKAALEKIAPEFSRSTGHIVTMAFDTVGAQRDRLLQAAKGEVSDIVVLSDPALDQLRSAGRLQAQPDWSIGRVAVSLAVAQGTPVPDISTPQALQATLLKAPSIAYADPARGATAGTHFDKVLLQMGLKAILLDRLTVLPFGVDVIKDVSMGKYALGVSQSSEILQHPGIAMVGPLPAPWGLTTAYSAALCTDKTGALQFLAYLRSPDAMRYFRDTGFLAQ